jgi:Tol biopolymer transport system component
MSGTCRCMAIAGLIALGQQEAAEDRHALEQRLPTLADDRATADVSGDGRFIAFESGAALVPADVNGLEDIYVLDRACDRITLESRARDGRPANGTSKHPRLSRDGRYLVFASAATNIDGAQTRVQVFLSDRLTGTVRLISRTPAGRPGNDWSFSPDVSDDGHIVVFASAATDLVDGHDRNGGRPDVFALDTVSQTIARVSVASDGVQPAVGESGAPQVSGDGRFVAFMSRAPLTEAVDPKPTARAVDRRHHVFVRDLRTSTTHLVSRTAGGRTANGSSWAPAISADGRWVAYTSVATNLASRDRNRSADVFLYDTWTYRTILVSRSPKGTPASGSSVHPAISADGHLVAFVTDAGDLLCAGRGCPPERIDVNLVRDIYLADMRTGTVQRASGPSVAEPWWEPSVGPALDAAGAVIVFSSQHPVDSADLSHDFDLFVGPINGKPTARRVTRWLETCLPGAER